MLLFFVGMACKKHSSSDSVLDPGDVLDSDSDYDFSNSNDYNDCFSNSHLDSEE